ARGGPPMRAARTGAVGRARAAGTCRPPGGGRRHPIARVMARAARTWPAQLTTDPLSGLASTQRIGDRVEPSGGGTMKLREIMSSPAVTFDVDSPVASAARLMRDLDIGGMSVLRHGPVSG